MTTSIIILTNNQLPLTNKCLLSIREHTQDYELIVIDNGSTDGTVAFLNTQPDVIVHANNENLGFAKGCNQGIELSKGETILFLNNDTIVTEHWLDNMLSVLYEDERVGMVGPVTNYSSGHQQIPIPYTDVSGIDSFARRHCEENAGCYMDVRRLVGFCLLTKRSVLDDIGLFDETFGLGNYEDDDLCLRALRSGYLLRVVHDSFIHHIGHATMKHLQETSLGILLLQNSHRAWEKWGNDIHQLIYKELPKVSLCMVTQDAELTLSRSLESILDEVDEIIIVDLGSTDKTVEIASNYTPHVFRFPIQEDEEAPYRYAFTQAIGSYVIWLEQGQVFTSKLMKKLCSLKFTIEGNQDKIALQGDTFLYRKDAGFQIPTCLMGGQTH
ncbi:glycosyltransferase [Paenibacillus albiflavus]|uniref:Glycosyltransferase n=1 Tax=Paenibacillus albiflavus TaxID=2545760 RepID=A0A4R4EKR5_9BACL|nr:glycosyltransferase family 2 protein [Paenibacillus albiflavus]TCZ80814.1 glycosyltransferase [Paenibacillus albiflavus]